MATRLYFSSTAVADVAPAYAGWGRTSEAQRMRMATIADGSPIGSFFCFDNGVQSANATGLVVQLVSAPLAAGVAFSPSDTIKCVARIVQNDLSGNINRQPLCLKVVSLDGATLRATLKALGHYGPATTEWPIGTLTNRQFADGDTLDGSYTTVAGDRLVLELGAQVDATGGTVTAGTIDVRGDGGGDVAENESGTTALNPWFEISRTLTFYTPPDDAGGCLLTILRRF